MLIENIKEDLQKKLSTARFDHSIGCAETATKYAETLGVDPKRAYLAGLVHDCAKYYPTRDYIELANRNDLDLDEYEILAPHLIHAPLGAKFARRLYGIEDEEILSAITYHTTGKPDMTPLEKIIFMADLTEPTRDFPDLPQIREIVKTDFELALLLTIDHTLMAVIEKGQLLHPRSVAARNFLLLQKRSTL
jgi:predicted HD superfamily hydrolase involved in NAD metabolism